MCRSWHTQTHTHKHTHLFYTTVVTKSASCSHRLGRYVTTRTEHAPPLRLLPKQYLIFLRDTSYCLHRWSGNGNKRFNPLAWKITNSSTRIYAILGMKTTGYNIITVGPRCVQELKNEVLRVVWHTFLCLHSKKRPDAGYVHIPLHDEQDSHSHHAVI